MPATLAEKFEPSFVDFDVLHERYRPMLAVVKELIGVVPNCDMALEMWRPGFRTYNLMVPNCLNLPTSILGRGAPKHLVGLGMYMSSRVAECAYCSAHTCSYALRRGASTEAVTGKDASEVEQAVVRLAEGMARIPADLEPNDYSSLISLLEQPDAEEIALGIALMGFLNKFMDAMGIQLEPESISDVSDLITPTGWSAGQHLWNGSDEVVIDLTDGGIQTDDLKTYARLLRQGPGAMRLERMWTKGVPASGPRAEKYVKSQTGLDVPILTEFRRRPMVRALATVLRDNLDPTISAVGLRAKSLAGWIYANHVGTPELVDQATELLGMHNPSLKPETKAELAGLAATGSTTFPNSGDLSERDQAVAKLALAISPSPAVVGADLVADIDRALTAAEVVEVVVWISVQQLMHRYRVFVDARRGSGLA